MNNKVLMFQGSATGAPNPREVGSIPTAPANL